MRSFFFPARSFPLRGGRLLLILPLRYSVNDMMTASQHIGQIGVQFCQGMQVCVFEIVNLELAWVLD
jgi:hypothetical protein